MFTDKNECKSKIIMATLDDEFVPDYDSDVDIPEEDVAEIDADEVAGEEEPVAEEADVEEEGDEDEEEEEEEEEEPDVATSTYDPYDGDVLRQEEGPQTDIAAYTQILSGSMAKYRTPPYLTQYERARVLGMRSQQLSQGAEPMVGPDVFPDKKYPLDDFQIAVKELQMRRMPFIIGRKLPNGAEIKIPVSSLLVLE